MKIPKGMTLFIGAPGSGKTTLAAYFCHKFLRRAFVLNFLYRLFCLPLVPVNCFSNVPILNTKKLVAEEDCGRYLIEDGLCCVDEAGITYNNRAYKLLPKQVIQFAKLYRHYGIKHFLLFSQGLDVDITFIRLCDRIMVVRRSIIPYFIFVRECKKVVGIDDMTKQLVDQYRYKFFGWHWVFMPTSWRYFDTYETPYLPSKSWPLWDHKTRFITPPPDSPVPLSQDESD